MNVPACGMDGVATGTERRFYGASERPVSVPAGAPPRQEGTAPGSTTGVPEGDEHPARAGAHAALGPQMAARAVAWKS